MAKWWVFSLAALIAAQFWFPAGSAAAQVIVSAEGPYRDVEQAIRDAGPGGTVIIRDGVYDISDLKLRHDITLIGEGNVTFRGRRVVAKGILNPLPGTSLDIRNITLVAARSPDQNGAGIRHEGRRLTVTNCRFVDNENGILATGEPGSSVTILSSVFERNGHGDGFSHGIYMSSGRLLTIEDSVFSGTRIGHHVKSIASDRTDVRRTRFDDGAGKTSYVVDVTGGGDMILDRNIIRRAADAEQETLFNYDTSRRGMPGRIEITGNEISNEKRRARLLRNPENAPVAIRDNIISNADGASLAMPWGEASPPPVTLQGSVLEEAEPGLTQEADLQWLSPQQRRAVEKMRAQGITPREVGVTPSRLPDYRSDGVPGVARPAEPEAPYRADLPVVDTGAESAPASAPAKNGVRATSHAQFERSSASGTDATILPVLDLPESRKPGDLAVLAVYTSERQGQDRSVTTSALPFEKRLLAAGSALELVGGGAVFPVQIDEKAYHSDGSVRHAVLSVRLGEIRNGTPLLLRRRAGALSDEAPALPQEYRMKVTIAGNGAPQTVNLRTLADAEIRAGRFWLDGPLVREVTVSKPLSPLLTLRADIRWTTDETVRTRLSFENHKSFTPGNRTLTYGVTVRNGNDTLMNARNISHHRSSNWNETFWQGGAPRYWIAADAEYYEQTGSIASFDLDHGISVRKVEGWARQLSGGQGGLAGLLQPYMPTTGMRDEIGLLPAWDIAFLKTPDTTTRQIMFAMADRAGNAPWHFEDEATGQPVRTDQRPGFWAEERGADKKWGRDALPAGFFDGPSNGITPDLAHKPLLTYTAYLVSGDPWYLRELVHEAAWTDAVIWPEFRQNALRGLDGPQTRAKAWLIRDLSAAAWIVPDAHPLKEYFEERLSRMLSAFLNQKVYRPAGAKLSGYLPAQGGETVIAPWQQDFLVMAVGLEAERGSLAAQEITGWMAAYIVGRFMRTNDPAFAIASRHHLAPTTGRSSFRTWQEVVVETDSHTDLSDSNPGYAGGYGGTALGALATIYSVTGDEEALAAINMLMGLPGMEDVYDTAKGGSVHTQPNFILALP